MRTGYATAPVTTPTTGAAARRPIRSPGGCWISGSDLWRRKCHRVVRDNEAVRVPAALHLNETLAGVRGQERVDVARPLGIVEVTPLCGPRIHRLGEVVEGAVDRLLQRWVHQHADAHHHELLVQ